MDSNTDNLSVLPKEELQAISEWTGRPRDKVFPDVSKLDNFAYYSAITDKAFRVAQQDTNLQIAMLLEKKVSIPEIIEVVVRLNFRK